jgi:hypothetical protein
MGGSGGIGDLPHLALSEGHSLSSVDLGNCCSLDSQQKIAIGFFRRGTRCVSARTRLRTSRRSGCERHLRGLRAGREFGRWSQLMDVEILVILTGLVEYHLTGGRCLYSGMIIW